MPTPALTTDHLEAERWRRRAAKDRWSKRVVLEAPFAGLPKGTVLFVGTPAILAKYIASIPRGETRSPRRLRRDIARSHRCEAMCPVSTAIFLRLIAEVAWDEIRGGRSPDDVMPFWRVVGPGSAIARRLRTPEAWLRERLEIENTVS